MHDGDTPLRGRGNVLFDSTYPTYDPPPRERRCRISAASVPNEKASNALLFLASVLHVCE